MQLEAGVQRGTDLVNMTVNILTRYLYNSDVHITQVRDVLYWNHIHTRVCTHVQYLLKLPVAVDVELCGLEETPCEPANERHVIQNQDNGQPCCVKCEHVPYTMYSQLGPIVGLLSILWKLIQLIMS